MVVRMLTKEQVCSFIAKREADERRAQAHVERRQRRDAWIASRAESSVLAKALVTSGLVK
jgi:hypothetical protein